MRFGLLYTLKQYKVPSMFSKVHVFITVFERCRVDKSKIGKRNKPYAF